MNIKDIEKDVLTKADNNLDPNTSSQLVQELQDKWGIRPAFDVANKLQKQGYLTNCHFFMDGGFLLGYPTPAGSEYLKELNHVIKESIRLYFKITLIQQFLLVIFNRVTIILLLKIKMNLIILLCLK